jgi:hypothetical protein
LDNINDIYKTLEFIKLKTKRIFSYGWKISTKQKWTTIDKIGWIDDMEKTWPLLNLVTWMVLIIDNTRMILTNG